MSDLAVFTYTDLEVRTVLIDGEPWFVVADLCRAGMYQLVLMSRKPGAKDFRRWVTSEALPAIRKTGRYDAQPAIEAA